MTGFSPKERGGREPADWAIGGNAIAMLALTLWGARQVLKLW